MSEITKQFVNVLNYGAWDDTAKTSVSDNGQIAFINESTSYNMVGHIYAQGQTFGDGALSEKTILNKDIKIAGGPLASDAVKNAFKTTDGDYVIPAGIDLQELLVKLLCVEKWPTNAISKTTANLTLSMSKPSITGSGTYEVGTSVAVKISGQKVSGTPRNASLSNFEYGYKQGVDEETAAKATKVANTSVSATTEYTIDGNSNYALTYSINYGKADVTDLSIQTINYKHGDTTGSKSINVTAYYGNNTINAGLSGVGATYSNDGIQMTWSLTNMDNIAESNKPEGNTKNYKDSIAAVTNQSVNAPSATSQSATIIGMYPVYHNGIEYTGGEKVAPSGEYPKSDETRKLAVFTPTTTVTKYIKFADTGNVGFNYKLYIASNYTPTITVLGWNPNTNSYDVPTGSFKKTATPVKWSEIQPSENANAKSAHDTDYYVYEIAGGGENGQKITIKLA